MEKIVEALIAINLELVSLLIHARTDDYGKSFHTHGTFGGCDAKNLEKIYGDLEKLEGVCEKEEILKDRAATSVDVGLTLTRGMSSVAIEKTLRNKLTEVRSELGIN